jgi:REP element-mobilizing transposase RayT
MDQAPYHLDQIRRIGLMEAIQEVCAHRGWNLLAAHVRSNHVHTVVEAGVLPERVKSDFKGYGSSRLNQMDLDEPEAMGTPWQHPVALETTARLGGHSVYCLRTG